MCQPISSAPLMMTTPTVRAAGKFSATTGHRSKQTVVIQDRPPMLLHFRRWHPESGTARLPFPADGVPGDWSLSGNRHRRNAAKANAVLKVFIAPGSSQMTPMQLTRKWRKALLTGIAASTLVATSEVHAAVKNQAAARSQLLMPRPFPAPAPLVESSNRAVSFLKRLVPGTSHPAPQNQPEFRSALPPMPPGPIASMPPVQRNPKPRPRPTPIFTDSSLPMLDG